MATKTIQEYAVPATLLPATPENA
ncbi:MAG: hypothetical protein JWO42_1573, partial [Chloroflexi bacterium]|nr:hypothetical protein [Chloroflexota bacterium]